MSQTLELIKSSIKSIPDYPKKGIIFRDITSLLEVPTAFQATVDLIAEHYKGHGITKVIGTESRGFIFWRAGRISVRLTFYFSA